MTNEIFEKIDQIIEVINKYKIEPILSTEIKARREKIIRQSLTENEIIKILIELIAFSQNAKSKFVQKVVDSGVLKEVFENFEVDKIAGMNPCDLVEEYWDKISGIRQQAKLFHIIMLARKIKSIDSFSKLLTETEIPKVIKTEEDINQFWLGFKKLLGIMKENKIPFFSSTTSLLHLLLALGYDCVKPDLVVMKVSKKIGIVDEEKTEKNLIKTVRVIQEYSIERKIKPAVIDLYFLIDEGQLDAKKYVESAFYKR
jgi:3-methyladenine DNA glycosylase Tag